jgi:hypothetical protein
MAKRRGNGRGPGRQRSPSPRQCCPKEALLCPERYSDPLLRETAARLNVILARSRRRHFQAIRFLLDLWRTMLRMSLEDVLRGRLPQDPRWA